jgi:hypothetical protein
VENRNVWDFRLTTLHDSPALTFILGSERRLSGSRDGAGMILDTSYQVRGRVNFTDKGDIQDMHEFNLVDGRTSLTIFAKEQQVNISSFAQPLRKGWIVQGGFRETNIDSGGIVMEWRTKDHISPTESFTTPPPGFGARKGFGSPRVPWDC